MIAWIWIGFIVFVLLMLAIDLGLLNRKAHVINTRRALIWTGFCVLLAMGFSVLVYFMYEHHWLGVGRYDGTAASGIDEHLLPRSGFDAAKMFFTGWIIEQSLSLDNIFVIALIFQYFCVPPIYQHRTLFWGILGALIMRGAMIGAGALLIQRFHWIIYVFGALLIVTAIKMLRTQDEQIEPDRNPLVKIARRMYPVCPHFEGERFFTRVDGKRTMTPLFLVLLVIESTDVLFAVDSIPAIFAITADPFIVFTSNVFAILNLRSLYFVLASMIDRFRYLKPSLVFVLFYVGVKMLVSKHFPIPTEVSLAIIVGILLVGVLASLASDRGKGSAPDEPDDKPPSHRETENRNKDSRTAKAP